MYQDHKIWIGNNADGEKVYIYPKMANRHGLIAGATGTGKTVTLRVMAESFSDAGVPVFLADIKGDLSAICKAGTDEGFVGTHIKEWNLEEQGFAFKGYPVTYWDVYGKTGVPLRTTISEMGPVLLSRILELNDTQSAIMTVLFKIADDEGLILTDTKDLKAMIQHASENVKDYALNYGNMTTASLAAITRAVVALEAEGGEQFFAEPALNIKDWIARDCDGHGLIQMLDCTELVNKPTMYSSFLLWMLSELYETLPEAGDLDKPKMVFFFDEAHLLFDSASKNLLSKIEQVVKLIRSKGVGVYFVTQNPQDVPDSVLAQLGNKVQHALHAYTPAELKKVKTAAQSFRANDAFDTAETIQALGIGEALVSVLDESGVPTIVERTQILPPQSRLGVIDDAERKSMIENDMAYNKYGTYVDNESAYEVLNRISVEKAEADAKAKEEAELKKQQEKEEAALQKQQEKEAAALEKQKEKEAAALEKQKAKEAEAEAKAAEKEKASKNKTVNSIVSSTAKTAGGTVGREVGNAVGKTIGGSFGKKLGGNIGASLGRGILGSLFKK